MTSLVETRDPMVAMLATTTASLHEVSPVVACHRTREHEVPGLQGV
jgi:hypothetical protein